MKKFTRTAALLFIGGSTLLTSCVSEDVSPELEELRQAQVAYLNAKAALEQAKADHEAAQVALLQLQIEYKQATSQAEIDAVIAEAKKRAADAELALQEAINNLAEQTNETAQEYLALYQNTTQQANDKASLILDQKTKVAMYESYIDHAGNIIDFEAVAEETEALLAEEEAILAALQAEIERLEGLNENAAAVEQELTEIQNQLDSLLATRADVQLEADLALNDLEPFRVDYQEAKALVEDSTPDAEQPRLAEIYEKYGVADFAELETLYTAAEDDYDAILKRLAALNTQMSALHDTALTLYDYLSGNPAAIAAEIEYLNGRVWLSQNTIESYEEMLINNEISAEDWAETIVLAQEKLERMLTEYNALLALATEYLEQFNTVVED